MFSSWLHHFIRIRKFIHVQQGTGGSKFPASCNLYSRFRPPSLVIPVSVCFYCAKCLPAPAPWGISRLPPSLLPPPVALLPTPIAPGFPPPSPAPSTYMGNSILHPPPSNLCCYFSEVWGKYLSFSVIEKKSLPISEGAMVSAL